MLRLQLLVFIFCFAFLALHSQEEHKIWNWERQVSGNYNPDDGVFVGLRLQDSKKHSGDSSLTTDQKLKLQFAWLSNSWALSYEAKINVGDINYFGAKKNTDLLFGIDLKQPNYTRYFYGYGDLSSPESELFLDNNNKFYRIRDQEIGIWARLDIELIDHLFIMTGVAMDWLNVSARDHESIFAELYSEENEIFYDRTYQSLDLGLRFEQNEFKASVGGAITSALNRNNADTYIKNKILASLSKIHRIDLSDIQFLELGSRIGMESNSGKKDLFYDLQLGSENYLRGYRKMRYTGSAGFYWNTDFRFKAYEIPNSWQDVSIGPIAFFDKGTVNEYETMNYLHRSFGGGIWIKPEKMEPYVISLSKGNAPEQPLILYIRHGFLF